MNVFLYSPESYLKELFIEVLFSCGITVYSKDDISQSIKDIVDKNVDSIFLDVDQTGIDWVNVIQFIKNKTTARNVFIVIMTASINKDYINSFLIAGVTAIFDKKQTLKTYMGQIKTLLTLFDEEMRKDGLERRKYIRVKVRLDEKIQINVEIAGKEHLGNFSNVLLDISLVGAAFKIENAKLLKLFQHKHTTISNLQIMINKRVYFCEGELVRLANNLGVVQFKKTNDFFNFGIAHYIYKKLNLDKIIPLN